LGLRAIAHRRRPRSLGAKEQQERECGEAEVRVYERWTVGGGRGRRGGAGAGAGAGGGQEWRHGRRRRTGMVDFAPGPAPRRPPPSCHRPRAPKVEEAAASRHPRFAVAEPPAVAASEVTEDVAGPATVHRGRGLRGARAPGQSHRRDRAPGQSRRRALASGRGGERVEVEAADVVPRGRIERVEVEAADVVPRGRMTMSPSEGGRRRM
jgi:hypothetical protein